MGTERAGNCDLGLSLTTACVTESSLDRGHGIDCIEENFIFKIANRDTLQKPDKDIKQTHVGTEFKEVTRAFPSSTLHEICRFPPVYSFLLVHKRAQFYAFHWFMKMQCSEDEISAISMFIFLTTLFWKLGIGSTCSQRFYVGKPDFSNLGCHFLGVCW